MSKRVSFAKKNGKDVLAPITSKRSKRFIIHPNYTHKIKIPSKGKKEFWQQIEPWKLAIKGKEHIKIFRSARDILRYEKEKGRVVDLLYKTNVIKSTRPCPRPECNGTLRIVHNPNLDPNSDWGRHGGWIYVCDGGKKQTKGACTGKNHKSWKAITYGTCIKGRIKPFQLLQLLYSYAVVSHSVRIY